MHVFKPSHIRRKINFERRQIIRLIFSISKFYQFYHLYFCLLISFVLVGYTIFATPCLCLFISKFFVDKFAFYSNIEDLILILANSINVVCAKKYSVQTSHFKFFLNSIFNYVFFFKLFLFILLFLLFCFKTLLCPNLPEHYQLINSSTECF